LIRYLANLTIQTQFAAQHGVEIGGYDLIVLDRDGNGYDMQAIDPASGQVRALTRHTPSIHARCQHEHVFI
jgi:hypothetical protein